ncbi:hypothetical protein BT63DRAFT_378584 [Microthyrium microscopicum]|uniref:Rhodopsin domain-containing protein n=1 Tax=Microthyrium microscopicum TaxID=703497 RepID=A0A6A6U0B5_9PEZI|nr:hypothetical protein BT63DRAFT_378584 [Microthyrium microscopicum]
MSLSIIPLKVLESWPAPNYKDPPERGDELVIISAILSGIACAFLILRLYTRAIKRTFGLDDALIVIAWITTMGLIAVIDYAYKRWRFNRHVWDIEQKYWTGAAKFAIPAKALFSAASGFVRASILILYLRILGRSNVKWIRWALHFCIVVNVLALIVVFFMSVFTCIPLRAYWTLIPIPGAKCLYDGYVGLAASIFNNILDLVVTILPFPIVSKLNLPSKNRIALFFLFGLGFVATAAGCVRTYYVWYGFFVSYDQTWNCYPLLITAAVELNIGIVSKD